MTPPIPVSLNPATDPGLVLPVLVAEQPEEVLLFAANYGVVHED